MGAIPHWSACLPRPGPCGVSIHAPGYTISSDWFRQVRDFDLWVMLDGEAEIRVDGGEWRRLGPGSCIWVTPEYSYEFRVTGPKRLVMTYVHFDLYTHDGKLLPPGEVEVEPLFCYASDPQFFETGVRRILLLGYLAREREGAEAELLRQQMAHLLSAMLYEYALRCKELEQPPKGGLEAHHQSVVSRAVAWIHEHPEAHCTMAELASRFGYNARYFCRLFLIHTGRTPRQMMIQAKIAHARELLASSAMNVGEIAESLGYPNIYYFSRQFSKEAGLSPTEYRTQLQKVQKRQM